MAKDFLNDKDREQSLSTDKEGSKFLKNPETEAPIFFLDTKYESGYVHYVKLPDGGFKVVACGGGEEGKGFAPEKCPICALVLTMYQEARALTAKGNKKGADLKARANKLRGSFSARFIVAMGEMLTIKENGQKVKVPDFDEAKVGILPMSQATFNAFCALATNGELPYIKSGKDLMSRVSIISKVKKANSEFSNIKIVPQENESEAPGVTWNVEDFDLASDFIIDMPELQKIYAALTNTAPKKEEVAYEDEDDDLLDDEDEIDSDEESDDLEDEDMDDSFLDDEGKVDLENDIPKKIPTTSSK